MGHNEEELVAAITSYKEHRPIGSRPLGMGPVSRRPLGRRLGAGAALAGGRRLYGFGRGAGKGAEPPFALRAAGWKAEGGRGRAPGGPGWEGD